MGTLSRAMPPDPDQRQEPRPRFDWRVKLVLFVSTAAVLFLALGPTSDAQVLGNDAIHYARAVRDNDFAGLLLANHLLPHVVARGLFLVGTSSGLLGADLAGALAAQQLVSALGAAAAGVLILGLAESLAASRATAVAATLVFLGAATTWLYGSVGETYLPAVAAEAWVLSATLALARRGVGRTTLAVALACAVCTREDAVLVAIVPLVMLGRGALRPLLIAAAIATPVFALAYAVAPTTAGPLPWLAGLATSATFGAGAERPSSATALLVHGVLTLDAVAFGVHKVAASPMAALPAVLVWLVLLAAFVPGRLRRDAPVKTRAHAKLVRRCAAACALHLVLRFGFYTWWQPSNLEYTAGHLVPIAALFAIGWRPQAARLALVGVAIQFAVNIATLVVPFSSDDAAREARAALTEAGPMGLVIGLDPFAQLALVRAHEIGEWPDVLVIDGSEANRPATASALADAASTTLVVGRSALAVGDANFATRLGIPPAGIPDELVRALTASMDFAREPLSESLVVFRLLPKP